MAEFKPVVIIPALAEVPNPRDPSQVRYDEVTYNFEKSEKVMVDAFNSNVGVLNSLGLEVNAILPSKANIDAVGKNINAVLTVSGISTQVVNVSSISAQVVDTSNNMELIKIAPYETKVNADSAYKSMIEAKTAADAAVAVTGIPKFTVNDKGKAIVVNDTATGYTLGGLTLCKQIFYSQG